MTIAFCLFRYFPYGGLQRDFLRIAQQCGAAGYGVRVYVLSWAGDVPAGFDVVRVPVRGWRNHTQAARYIDWVQAHLVRNPVQLVVGFNRMPGLDVYYAADVCYAERASQFGWWRRLTGRHRFFVGCERAVCGAGGARRLLLLSAAQQAAFARHYDTHAARMSLLPPAINRDRMAPANADAVRARMRASLALRDDEWLLLAIGSGFRTKGLDRSIRALAAVPLELRARTRLLAVGQGSPGSLQRLARRLGVGDRVNIQPGRDDIADLLQAGDLLIHPARLENTGTVLVEAIVAGLPVLTTGVCGYADHVRAADAGCVLDGDFSQPGFDALLATMLRSPKRPQWRANGIAYGQSHNVYDGSSEAVRLILDCAAEPTTPR